jgi:Domain of unknown function (DUF4277)
LPIDLLEGFLLDPNLRAAGTDLGGDILEEIEPTFRITPKSFASFRRVGRISSPEEPTMPQPSRSQILDHLGLVAGMFDELGIADVIDQATQQHPATRLVTVGHAVEAMVLNGLGFVNQRLSLVPMFVHHKPTHRLIALDIEATHLNDDP